MLPQTHSHLASPLVTNGEFNLGRFHTQFDPVNPLDAQISSVKLPKAVKNLFLKEWEHFALLNDRYFISIAIFNSKRLGLAHIVLYDRETKTTTLYETRPRPRTLVIPAGLFDSVARVSRPDMHIEIRHELGDAKHFIEFECPGDAKRPPIQGNFICHEDLNTMQPIVVCLPLKKRRAMYSHKGVFPMQGKLHVGDETILFSQQDSFAIPDIHKGYYPYVMKWHWATGAGRDADGRLIGFNLTNNQVKDQATYNENCLWIDGKARLLPPVTFSMPRDHTHQPWRIKDANGEIDIQFHPEAMRSVDINLLLLRSKYRGPYGSFSGFIRDAQGVPIPVDPCFGLTEDFYLRA